MLKVHFTSDDLGRVRMSGALDPMWEIIGSVQLLQTEQMTATHLPWLRHARQRLTKQNLRFAARILSAIAPAQSYFPDFLTPDRPTCGLEADIQHIASTPVHRLRAEIGRLGATPGWLAGMARGDPQTLTRFGNVIRHYYELMIAPDLKQLEVVLGTHRANLVRTLMRSGTEDMLDSIAPMIRWRPPYLVARYPMDRTIQLSGRGLLLVPSFFCARMPVALVDPHLTPVLVYPVERPMGALTGDSLAELMGNTRAEVLKSLLDGAATTGELARRVGISLPTISHHTNALRNAGLIISDRSARQVVHRPSSLGFALLAGSQDPADQIW